MVIGGQGSVFLISASPAPSAMSGAASVPSELSFMAGELEPGANDAASAAVLLFAKNQRAC